jgi:hypothetical protein
MPEFDVTKYAVVRIKVNGVEAADANAAIEKVQQFDFSDTLNREYLGYDLSPVIGSGELAYVADADETMRFLVDEKVEDQDDKTTIHDSEGKLLGDQDYARANWIADVTAGATLLGFEQWLEKQSLVDAKT